METLREVTLPETKPGLEWINGRAVRKLSPTRKHGRLQLRFGYHLDVWANGRGNVSSEWRFRVTPPGRRTRPLIPDLAYMSYDRLRPLSPAEREVPTIAPEIVIEIRSPRDERDDIDEKRRVFLAWGVLLVIVVDPETRSLEAFDSEGRHTTCASETYSPEAFPDLVFPLREIFDEVDIPEA
jgi:Uma2 family endonuclease